MSRLTYVTLTRNLRARFVPGYIPRARLGLLIAVALFLLVTLASVRSGQRSPVFASSPAPYRQVAEDHLANIPYFTESEGMRSTLTLNNNMSEAAEATVTIFNRKGESMTPLPISLLPNSVERISLKSLTESARGDFNSGSIQVFYHGPSMAVTCQVSITSEQQRLSFESIETSAMNYSSTRLDSIVWTLDRVSRSSVAVSNTTAGELSATITAGREQGKKAKQLILRPREMQLIDLREFLNGNKGTQDAVLVSLEHNGAPGALIATGFALNERTGFSCNLPFVDAATAKSTHLAGAHVRFGRADATEAFPPGTRFLAPLVIANVSNAPTKAHIFLDYTARSEAKRVDLGEVNLDPQEIKQIEISQEMTRRGVKGPVDDAGVDIEYSGQPGAVIARLTCVDASGDFSFDVPVKDPLASSMSGSGGNPWRLDKGYTTVIHLKNTLNKPVYALAQVRYEAGSYNLERIAMAAYQTVAIDIRALRDRQEPDIRGSVMPEDVESGQVAWFEEEVGSLIGRAELANIDSGVSASFSCPQACQCPPSFNNAYLAPSSSVGPVGGTAQFIHNEMRRDCHNVSFGPYNRTQDSSWSSSNTAVMTVSAGRVSCLGPGSAALTARFQAIVYGLNCFQNFINPTTGGNVAVVRVTFQKADGSALPSPLRVGITATTLGGVVHDRKQSLRAVVDPAAEAANVTIQGSSKLQVSNVTRSGGVITFNVVGTTRSMMKGDASIIASHSGTTLGTVTVSVTVPWQIAVPHDKDGGGLVIENRALNKDTSPGLIEVPSNQFALVTVYIRNLTIKVLDQFGETIGDVYQGAEISESLPPPIVSVFSINQFLTASSTYKDPVGPFEGNTIVPAGDPRVASWPSQSKIPLRNGTNSGTQRFSVFVDGFRLNPDPAIDNRMITAVGNGQSTTSPPVSVTITWP